MFKWLIVESISYKPAHASKPTKEPFDNLNSPPKEMFSRKEEKYRNLLTFVISFKQLLGQLAMILTTGSSTLNLQDQLWAFD